MTRIAIIGAGAIAQAYLKVLLENNFADLRAVVDLRHSAARAAAEVGGCDAFTSYKDMYETVKPDAVIICTPPKTHPEISLFFLNKKVPVLCEKPLAVNQQEAELIISKSRETNTLLTMASKFRYATDVIEAKSIIESGLLGEIKLLENAFVSPVDMSKRWNSNKDISGGGVCIDNGTHSVDIVRYLIGPIKSVHMDQSTYSHNIDVEDNVNLLLKTESGADARIDLSWTFDKSLPNFISVYGTNGVMHVGWKCSKYKQNSSSDWITFGKGYQKLSAFQNKLKNFCDAVKGTGQPLVSCEDAMASVLVVQAAYQSVKNECWVTIPTSVQE